MATAWQTMEEAALTLGVSSRTLHRRITKGEYETRLNNGRREVLVDVGDTPQFTSHESTAQPPASATGGQDAAQQPPAIDGSLLALHEDRIRRTDMAIAAYQRSVSVAANEARRWRIGAQVAWGFAAVAVTALFLTGLWATHRLTAASAQVTNLSGQVRQLSDTTTAQSQQVEQFRREAESARVDAARAQGALSAQQERAAEAARRLSAGIAPAPATQPSILQRYAIPPVLGLPLSANTLSAAADTH